MKAASMSVAGEVLGCLHISPIIYLKDLLAHSINAMTADNIA
jgi:hypothetical protein